MDSNGYLQSIHPSILIAIVI